MKADTQPKEHERLIKPREARERLCISTATEWRLNKSGKLKPVFICGSKRYNETYIDDIVSGKVEV